MMETMIQDAAESRGQTYLKIEHELMRNNPVTLRGLQQNIEHADPIIRLMVSCLLSWTTGNAPEYQSALDYLDEIPKRAARTPAMVPAPESIAYVLNERFASKVAEFLSLRLIKEPNWPQWRVEGILLYLEQQKQPSTVSALLRFTTETENDEYRNYAIEAIQAIDDPELETKVQIERRHLESRHHALVEVLESLAPQVGPAS